MKKLMLLAAITLVFVVASAAPSKDSHVPMSESTTKMNGVILSAWMDSRVPVGAKKVTVHVRVENHTSRELYHSVGSGISYWVFTHDDHRVSGSPFGESNEDEHPMVVPAGKSIEFERDIASRSQIDKPNQYKVVVRLWYNDQDDNGWGALDVAVPFYVGNPPTPWKQPPGGI